MPIYEYACNECGHRFDIRQSWSDDSLTDCPECTGHIRRVMHPAGVIFKGSGWYITDSRKPESNGQSSTKADKAEKADKTDNAEKSDSAKPASEPAKPKVESKTTADT